MFQLRYLCFAAVFPSFLQTKVIAIGIVVVDAFAAAL
jgi:hypothetical protein